MIREAKELVRDELSYNLNDLLARILRNTSIRSLEIVNLSVYQDWGLPELSISSPFLQYLRIEHDAFGRIVDLNCPELLELKHLNLAYFPFHMELKCLLHAEEVFSDGPVTVLGDCKKIERINDIDVKSLRKKVNMDEDLSWWEDIEGWENVLEEACHCNFDV